MAGLAKSKMKNKAGMAAEMLGLMFDSRDYAHLAHLKTGSYSKHRALDTFYTELLELTDELAEVAQGMYGKLDITISGVTENVNDPIGVLQKHMAKIEALGEECDGRALNKVLDDVSALYARTIYKLIELD
jgi:hypothetical protein